MKYQNIPHFIIVSIIKDYSIIKIRTACNKPRADHVYEEVVKGIEKILNTKENEHDYDVSIYYTFNGVTEKDKSMQFFRK